MKSAWQKYSVPLTTEENRNWVEMFVQEQSSFGKFLENVFDAELVKTPVNTGSDPHAKPDRLEFSCAPQNKDKLLYALLQCKEEYFERGGVYCAERAKEFFESVKSLPCIPANSPKP